MIEFFAMGGYGFFVWGSCAITAALITAEIMSVRARLKRARAAAGDAR